MQTLDEMRDRCLLTHEQHAEIGAWVSQARTPEAILAMPEGLWRTLELASVRHSPSGMAMMASGVRAWPTQAPISAC